MKNRVGEKWQTIEGYIVTIIVYRGTFDCDIQFDNGFILKNVRYGNIIRGNIKNPYHPSVYGVGYVGEGSYKTKIGGVKTVVYDTWIGMIRRCYSVNYHNKRPTYIGSSVDKQWYNFQTFAQWFEENYIEGFALDKDILFKGNKIYNPETCCFVPVEINSLFTKRQNERGEYPIGVSKKGNKFQTHLNKGNKKIYIGLFESVKEAFQAYKLTKESYIKELANKYKEQITEPCYNALLNYKVEIND